MKPLWILTSCCLALAVSPAYPADRFAERFALQFDPGSAYYSVRVPAAIYAASQRSDLGDIRVLDGAGEAVPYSLDAPHDSARTPPTLHSVNWFPLPRTSSAGNGMPRGVTLGPDGSLHASSAVPGRTQHDTDLLDLGEPAHDRRVSALLVHVRDDNYQGRVSVESSDDLRHWQPAGDAQLLKVSYNGTTLSQDRIELDGARGRYVRLRWADGVPYVDSIDMEVEALAAGTSQRADAQQAWREGIVAHAGPRAGEYFFSTGGPYPVDRLRLGLPQPNTVAPAVVYSRNGLDAPWREVASATLFRLHNGSVEQSNPSLELPPDTDRQWRVVIDTRNGSLGSGALTVAAGWRPAVLSFVAQGAAPYTLVVGSMEAESAAVSRADLLGEASSASSASSAVAGEATVGDPLPSAPLAEVPTASENRAAKRRYWLGAALLLAVSSLGGVVWWRVRGARRRRSAGLGTAETVEAGSLSGATPGTPTDAQRVGDGKG